MAILTTTDQGLNFTGGSSFIKTGTSTVMSFTTSGNVGIGTTNPSSKLYIGTYGSSINSSTLPTTPANHLITLTPPSTTNYYGGGIGWSEGTNVAASINAYDAGTGGALGLVFSTGNNTTLSEALRINSSGNVGIGTTNPSAKLDIDSVFTFNTSTDLLTITNNQNTGGIKLSGGNSRIYFGNYRAIEGDQAGGTLYIGEGYGAISLMDDVYINGQLTLNGYVQAGNVKFERGGINNSSYTMLCTVNGDRLASIVNMTITGTSGGVVLCSSFEINVNHYQDIHVRSLSGDYTEATIRITSNNNEDYSIELKHNGSTTTTVEVCVFPQAGETITPTTTDPNYTGTEYVHLATEGIRFGGTDGATESSNLVVDGKVGIGTANPAQKLHVNGNVDIDNGGILLQQAYGINFGVSGYDIAMPTTTRLGIKTAGSESISILNTGNVGIGTTGPSRTLHIVDSAGPTIKFQRSSSADLEFTFGTANASIASAGEIQFRANGGTTNKFIINNSQIQSNAKFLVNTNSGIDVHTSDSGNILLSGNSSATGNPDQFFLKHNLGNVELGNSRGNINITSGNVGIGTTSPSRPLDVQSAATSIIANFKYTGAAYSSIDLSNTVGSARISSLNNDLLLSPAGTERMRINSSGNVGIGTTSPTASLHINKSTPSITLETTANSNDPIINLKSNGAITGEGAQMWYDNSIGSLHIQTTYPNNAADIVFHTATGADKSTGNVRMVIGGDGNVGIGTTSPAQPLHVLNDSSANVHAKIRVQGGSTSGYADLGVQSNYVRLLVNDVQTTAYSGAVQYNYINGNVATTLTSTGLGISTTNPQAALHVAGSIGNSPTGDGVLMGLNNNYGHIQLNGSTGSYIDFSSSGVDRKGRILYNNAGNYMQIQTNGSDKVRITSSGNVGIGTTSPSNKLHVYEAVNRTTAIVQNNNHTARFEAFGNATAIDTTASNGVFIRYNGSNRVHFEAGGNVGIGTDSPDQKLEVNGNAHLNYSLIGRGIRSSNRGELHLNATSTNDVSEIFFGHGDGYTEGNIRWAISDRGFTDGRLDLYRGPAFGGFSAIQSWDENGYVGIGTTSPEALLDIGGGDGTPLGTQFRAVIKGTSARTLYLDSDSSGASMWWGSGNTPHFAIDSISGGGAGFWTYSGGWSQRLTINSSGNVGIGTNNPASKLTVGGNATGFSTGMQVWQSGQTALSGDVGGKAATFFGTSGLSNSSIVNIYSTDAYTTQRGGEIGFGGKYASAGNVAQFAKIRSFKTNATNGGVNYGGGLEFWTRPNGSAAVPRMHINGDGNVGIGTTSPNAILDISDATNDNLRIGTRGGNMSLFSVTDAGAASPLAFEGSQFNFITGNVGIGTTGPATKLHVVGRARFDDTQINAKGVYADYFSSGQSLTLNSGASASILFKIGNTTALTLDSSENATFAGYTSTPNSYAQNFYVTSSGTNITNRIDNDGTQLYITYSGTSNRALEIKNSNGDATFAGDIRSIGTIGVTQSDGDYLAKLYQSSADGFLELFTGQATPTSRTKITSYGDSYINPSNGNVGIGTTSPAYKLDVAGSARIEGDLDLGSGFKIANYGGSYWQRIRTEDSSLSTTNAFNFETRNGSGSFIEHMVIRNDGNVGIGVTNPSYKLQVGGSIVGTSKNFIIDHPTKEGKKLLHGCIEGPEAAVYFRGKSTSNIIEMPDYWIGLVDIDTMTVDITPWGPNQDIYVESIADDGEITIAANTEEPLNYFYVVYGERKDIDKLEIEIVDPEYSD